MTRFGRRLRRLGHAFRGLGELEDKLMLLGAIGLALFVTLVATLFYVQHSMGRVQRQLVEQATPAEERIAQLETSIAAAFGRQAQVSSTADLAQLAPLRDRKSVEGPLRATARDIGERLTGMHPEVAARAGALARHVEDFLAADDALLASVGRRHELQAAFEKQLGAIDADVRALVEDSQAVSGMLRLEYVLVLRGIAASLERGAPRADLVRTAVLGDVRGALDDTGELANAVLALGWVGGKIGLAASSDAINSIVANELPQAKARLVRLISSLDRRMGARADAAARMKALVARFDGVTPRIMDEKRDDSLVSLRRRVVAEAGAAAKIRAQAIAAAAELTVDTAFLEGQVAGIVADSVRAQRATSATSLVFSLAVTLLGLLGCYVGARRIRQGVQELEDKNQRLVDLTSNLESLNANLESKVAERTSALVERDRGMQRVLDSMHEGLVTVSLDGTLRPERSHAFGDWFGDAGHAPIWDVLYPDDAERAAMFRCGFEQVVEDVLPFEVAVDQMPRQVTRGGRTYELELLAVDKDDRLDAVLFVIHDVTDRIGALAAERAAREEHKLIANLLRDRRGFQRSVDELDALVATVQCPSDASVLRRALHTLKGNCAVLGFAAMAERAHMLEDELQRDGELAPGAAESLRACFRSSLHRIHEFIEEARGRIDIDAADYATLVAQLKANEDYDKILALVQRWELEPVATVLTGLAGHARRLAEQLGRRVVVVVEGNGIRVGEELTGLFASLVHVIRNAIDHGIESPETRVAAGKLEAGRLDLTAAVDGDRLVVSVTDDGAGVDIERVRERARALGLPHETRGDVLEAMFVEGLTTRTDVTETSGRGIGTSAVLAACRALGGDVEMDTEWGRGTTVRCVLPVASLGISPVRLAGAA